MRSARRRVQRANGALVIVAEAAGRAGLLAQGLVARHLLLEGVQRAGAQAEAGEPDELDLEQQARIRCGDAALRDQLCQSALQFP